MKKLLCSLLVASFATVAMADIQDPPANDFGPTRKFSRAISNILYGSTEIWYTIEDVNADEGNAAAFSYGLYKGIGRTIYRVGAGWSELLTFPYPTYKGSYRPFYKSDIPWVNGGYSEFAPELGYETKLHYTRSTSHY